MSTISVHTPSFVKFHRCLLELSFGNEKRTDGRTTDRRADGRTDRHTDVQRETIIPRHYRVAGYNNTNKKNKKKTKKTKKKKEDASSLLEMDRSKA